ncbi:electron transfer flavoprotein subunit alpha/FixB family protein [Sphaerochaeta sp. PS]|uniref:electron transfer flavoprotein subunit alpha/FixB family protein n=1 Tax=Sphaerochaeta sp. PS TaxID=3076336 RepID=UPI0028A48058|nr:electron transfer flavoprotein subunit alpha/FixB family protein [Sphaerochaeta sp. PS]MDT4761628.1 electron transfer flavoprotein subunit alpha/FixB family protein [Sphaerochaeta sp. PS]
MHEVWIIAEENEGKIKEISYELLARGRALADTLKVELGSVVLGHCIQPSGLDALIAHGSDRLYVVDDKALATFSCERYALVLESLITTQKPQIVIAGATTMGRTLMPYVAVRTHAGLTADCTELGIEEGSGNLLQTRPAIGGNIMATIKTPNHRPQMATVRPRSTRALPIDLQRRGLIEYIPFLREWDDGRLEVLGLRKPEGQQLSIEEADMVVSGGRGMKKRDNFQLIERLARLFGAQVGASRDAVDRGWASYPHQVGLSGKTISPRLYLAVGISGAVQHLAGIKTAGCIVAINSDEHANLLDIADFAIVGDLFSILPQIERHLEQRSKV